MKLTKPELSSIELRAIVNELNLLGKVDQIYQSGEKEFVFQIYTKSKQLLKITAGKMLYVTSAKPLMAEPKSFCMQLRKHLNGNYIKKVEQLGAQRIVKITLEGFYLFIELFSKGNIILCDEKMMILGLLENQRWESRELKPKVSYKAPPEPVNIFSINKQQISELLKKTQKDKLVTFLATELGMGGLYAEELCLRAGLDKNMHPAFQPKLLEEINAMMKEKPKGHLYEGNIISPIKLSLKLEKELDSFNEAIDSLLTISKDAQERAIKESKYKEKLGSLQSILDQQEAKLEEFDRQIKEETLKADAIYENYPKIKKLLDYVSALQESGWVKVKEELAKLKKVKKVDLKDKKVEVEI